MKCQKVLHELLVNSIILLRHLAQFGTRKDGRHYPKIAGKKTVIKDMAEIEKQTESLEKAVVKKSEELEERAEKGKADAKKLHIKS